MSMPRRRASRRTSRDHSPAGAGDGCTSTAGHQFWIWSGREHCPGCSARWASRSVSACSRRSWYWLSATSSAWQPSASSSSWVSAQASSQVMARSVLVAAAPTCTAIQVISVDGALLKHLIVSIRACVIGKLGYQPEDRHRDPDHLDCRSGWWWRASSRLPILSATPSLSPSAS